MGRPERVLLADSEAFDELPISIGVVPEIPIPWLFPINLIEMMLIWFAVAGNLTAVQRAMKAWKSLEGK